MRKMVKVYYENDADLSELHGKTIARTMSEWEKQLLKKLENSSEDVWFREEIVA